MYPLLLGRSRDRSRAHCHDAPEPRSGIAMFRTARGRGGHGGMRGGGACVSAVVLQFYMSFVFLQGAAEQKAAEATRPAGGVLLDFGASAGIRGDSLLRRSPSVPVTPYTAATICRYFRAGGIARITPRSSTPTGILPAYCCRSRELLEYVYFTSEDLSRETGDEDRRQIQRIVRDNPELTPIFQAGIGTIYKVLPPRP